MVGYCLCCLPRSFKCDYRCEVSLKQKFFYVAGAFNVNMQKYKYFSMKEIGEGSTKVQSESYVPVKLTFLHQPLLQQQGCI